MGCVAGIFVTPGTALSNGKYFGSDRTRDDVTGEYIKRLSSWLEAIWEINKLPCVEKTADKDAGVI